METRIVIVEIYEPFGDTSFGSTFKFAMAIPAGGAARAWVKSELEKEYGEGNVAIRNPGEE